MELSATVRELRCTDCETTVPASDATGRCSDCDGPLAVDYEYDAVDLDRDALAADRYDGIARYAELLPFDREQLVTMDEGTTPLVDSTAVADELGVGAVHIKDEGANTTGSVTDRGVAVAVTAAAEANATDVALPTTGASGLSAAAYAARAGVESHVFVPSRAVFDHKAMINVHGGDMSVVGGRYGDAVGAFTDAMEDDWFSLAPFDHPYRLAGAKTLAYELAEQLDWAAPDAVVHPTGTGLGIAGLRRGFRDLQELGVVETVPALYAAQAEGCAPVVAAVEADAIDTGVDDQPDTICGGIEIADPPGGALVLDAIRETDGGAVAVDDDDSLEWATATADTVGVGIAASAGPAVAGANALAESGTIGTDDTVVAVNTTAATLEADVLRSHLMSKGI